MGLTFNARMGQDVGQAHVHVLLPGTVHSIGSADPFGPSGIVVVSNDNTHESKRPSL